MVADGSAARAVRTILGEVEVERLGCHVFSVLEDGEIDVVWKIGVGARKKLYNSTPFTPRCGPLGHGAPTSDDRTVQISIMLRHGAKAEASQGRMEFKCPVPSMAVDD
jgi:hypothetical protein